MNRVLALLTLLWVLHASWQAAWATPSATAMLTRACQFLWDKQSDDGGWHSETHGLLHSGQAWTPFILWHLLQAPATACGKHPTHVERALHFLHQHLTADGVLGLADPDLVEYPNYATAYALRVLARYGRDTDKPWIEKMKNYLLAQQFDQQRGIGPDHLAYGSWGFGEQHLALGMTGHVDLSHTRRVLQALRDAGHTTPATYTKATAFLRLLQRHPSETRPQPGVASHAPGQVYYDGGFYFSPVVLGANKAQQDQGRAGTQPFFRSYATATCDGVLALLATGATPDDEPVQAAIRWLQAHPSIDHPQGIPEEDPEQWHKVLVYYHLSVRAEAYRVLHWPGPWRQAFTELLAQQQRPDGSFVNPAGAPNKEDDPLLATALAVDALTQTLW